MATATPAIAGPGTTCHCGARHSEKIPFMCGPCADKYWNFTVAQSPKPVPVEEHRKFKKPKKTKKMKGT